MSKVLYSLLNVEQRYGRRTVLRLPELAIPDREIFAVVGPSGAGKSTLVRLLALLEAPSQGSVNLCLNGRDVTYGSVSLDERRQISMVFQRPTLLSRSVRANVSYGLANLRGEHNTQSRVDNVLARVCLTDLANAHSRTLSGGEMQRVAMARALVLEPRILLLDEPTANLDPHNVRLIEDMIHEQSERYGTTVILITHNIFQARRLATHVGLLLQGELIEVAPVEEFFTSPLDPRTASFLSGELVY